jgi:exodeoxyribonuclease VII small subunit
MAKTPDIETCFAAIEKAIASLEDGQLPLDKALSTYEKGLTSVRQARSHLDAFAERLAALREDADDDGQESA